MKKTRDLQEGLNRCEGFKEDYPEDTLNKSDQELILIKTVSVLCDSKGGTPVQTQVLTITWDNSFYKPL
jgi:hypothetical protein